MSVTEKGNKKPNKQKKTQNKKQIWKYPIPPPLSHPGRVRQGRVHAGWGRAIVGWPLYCCRPVLERATGPYVTTKAADFSYRTHIWKGPTHSSINTSINNNSCRRLRSWYHCSATVQADRRENAEVKEKSTICSIIWHFSQGSKNVYKERGHIMSGQTQTKVFQTELISMQRL